MKKNKRKYILMLLGTLIVILTIVLILNLQSRNDITGQDISLKNKNIDNFKINDLELKQGTIEKMDGYYRITMAASNNTNKDIDMSNYRISFRNSNDIEIDWFRGTAIGVVKAGETKQFIIDSTMDLSDIKTLYYEEFEFIN